MARTYKIRDNTTGQMTDIPEEQLTQYGLSTSTTMPQISQTVPNYNQESKPSVADFGVGGLPKSYEDRKRQDLLNDINTTGGKRKDVINNFYDTYKVSDETIAGLKEQELKDNFNSNKIKNRDKVESPTANGICNLLSFFKLQIINFEIISLIIYKIKLYSE